MINKILSVDSILFCHNYGKMAPMTVSIPTIFSFIRQQDEKKSGIEGAM